MLDLSLPQLEAAMAACSRRDADSALLMLRVVNAGHAPLVAGKEGGDAFDRLKQYLTERALPPDAPATEKQIQNTAFAKLMEEARRNSSK